MSLLEKISAAVIVMTISMAIQFFKYKFPSIFLNFGVRPEKVGGFGLGSKLASNNSEEVKKYKQEQKSKFIKLLLGELVFFTLFFLLY